MTIHYVDDLVTVHHGDCLDVLRTLDAASVDAVVTDPPYGLEFMGKAWDSFKTYAGGNPNMKPQGATVGGDMGGDFAAASYGYRQKNPRCRVCGKLKRGNGCCKCPAPQWDTRTSESAFQFQAWCEDWAREVWRVLKPGGHLLAFGGTRTWHRLTCAIEDAGFEVRDSIAWLYGSGFPKSLDVSKAIDKARDDLADIHRVCAFVAAHRSTAGLSNRDIDAAFGFNGMAGHWTNSRGPQAQVPKWEQWQTLKALLSLPDDMDAEVWRLNGRKGTPGEAWERREVIGSAEVPVGHAFAGSTYGGDSSGRVVDLTAPATPDAEKWQGWGTALKPAHEPIVVARKPLTGTVAANVLTHGTGALNIDACRVATSAADLAEMEGRSGKSTPNKVWGAGIGHDSTWQPTALGRWPANVVLDEHAAAELDRQSGTSVSGTAVMRNGGGRQIFKQPNNGEPAPDSGYGDTGGASRFFPTFREDTAWSGSPAFPAKSDDTTTASNGLVTVTADTVATDFPTFRYEPKAPTTERPRVGELAHATVKPLDLMRWLVRLVTPPGGLVVDPFAGSGTTGEACIVEGFRAVLIEREADYLPLITARLSKPIQPDLFGGAA